MNIGDYIKIGSYYKEPIVWRVIDKTDDKLLVFAEHILTYKAFDSKEQNNFSDDSDRIHYGSNRWKDSNIRDWLNSDDEQVKYQSCPPQKEGVWGGFNAYHDEPGFLSGFTNFEKSFIKPIEISSTIPELDRTNQDSSIEGHEFECAYPDIAFRNYNESLRETSLDRVFLPSIKEIKELVLEREWEWAKLPTLGAILEDDSQKNYTWYWTRTVTHADSHGVRNVSSDGYLDCRSAYRSTLGVAPIMSLSTAIIHALVGDGSSQKPYRINKVKSVD